MNIAFIYSTFPTKESAEKVQTALVENKLAGCANVFPIDSVYEWKDMVQEDDEWVIMAKTLPSRTQKVCEYISKHHPYDIPCVLSWNTQANNSYVAWMESCING
jgi:periplasmic divalent cation tolerance protein